MKSLSPVSLLFLAWVFAPSFLLAQDTAQLTGTVSDPSGAAVANAQVVITSEGQGTSRSATSNGSGGYLFSALSVGKYDMTVTAPGFKKYEAKGIVLDVGQKARNDVRLAVGTAQEQVNVEGTSVAQVETESSELAGTITGKEITQLQLNGRNFTQLVNLTPGVNNQTGQDEGTVGVYGNVSYSVNGGRTEYNNWEVDGGDNMDNGSNDTLNTYPSIDAIAEFKVLTSNYGAQYGRNGSGTVEVETKSGTNRFHGDAYEFWRNEALNAKNMFDQVQNVDGNFVAPPYKKNDYGYTVGGPVWKDHTFFFWSQEWRKEEVPTSFNQAVPSIAERQGNFSDLCPNVNSGTPNDFSDCPTINGRFTPNLNTVPGFNINDANVQALLSEISLPTTGVPGAEFFTTSITTPTNWREELIRVDHNITNNQRITFRYIHDSWNTIVPTPLWTNGTSFPTIQNNFNGPGTSLVARLTSTINPTLLNEAVFSYTTDHIVLNSLGNWQRTSNITIGGIFQNGFNGTLPGVNLVGNNAYGGGFAEDAGYIPNGTYNSNPTYTARDNVTKIVGKHNLQFGAYAVFGQKNELGAEISGAPVGSVPGLLTFSNTSAVSTGNALADLELGDIANFGQQNAFRKYYNRYKIVEPYFQDDWRVTSRLTLNLGLRISLFGTYREKYHQAFNFDPAFYNPALAPIVDDANGTLSGTAGALVPSLTRNPFNGIVQCGGKGGVFPIPGFPNASVAGISYPGCMSGHLFNPGPRIGFAYDPTGSGKTAIRGGYGIFFEHSNGNEANTESLENSPPLAFAEVQNNIVGYQNIGVSSAGTTPIFPLSVVAIPTKAVWPYVQQWHLDVQHQLPGQFVATLAYVGSSGTHLGMVSDLNQLPPVSNNPYKPGETFGSSDCANTDAFLVPQSATTPSGVPIPYGGLGVFSPAVNEGVAICGTDADPFRIYKGFSNINNLQFAASSNYNALQFSVRRNVGQLQLSLAYTYSHSIDDASDRFDTSFVNSFDFAANRASSNFDERHVLNIGYIWTMPFFQKRGLANKLLGGWEYSGITTFNTGSPFSPTFATVSDNAGVANGIATAGARPDVVGDPNAPFTQVPLAGHGPQWYDPAAFATPTALTFGTVSRNFLRNPNFLNFDMALFKHIPVRESMGFEFRAEAFNVFNQSQWANLGGDSGSAGGTASTAFPTSDFVYINSAHNPRILQLALKFLF
jgi:Carboxypeptidase regulatory-like domain/TonB-dependent Receptor Plug Domain